MTKNSDHHFDSARIALALVALTSLSACNGLAAQSRANPRVAALYGFTAIQNKSGAQTPAGQADTCKLTRERYDTRDGAINLDCFKFKDDGENFAYVKATTGTEDEKKVARNRLASAIIGQSDAICNHTLGKLTADEATVNTTLSTLTSAFTAAGAIVSGNMAKSILSGTASLTSGGQSHVNLYVFRNQIAPVIIHAINLAREKKLKELKDNFESPTLKWPMDLAIRDINSYNQDCSLYRGFEILLATTENVKNLEDYKKAADADKANSIIQIELNRLKSSDLSKMTDAQIATHNDLILNYEKKLSQQIVGN